MIYSKKQVANKYGVSVKTVERKVTDGSLPFHQIGSRVLFDDNDLEIFWKSCQSKRITAVEKAEVVK